MLPQTVLILSLALLGGAMCKDTTAKSEKRGVDTSTSYTSGHTGYTGASFIGGHGNYVTPVYSNGYNSNHATPSGYTSLHGTPSGYTSLHGTPASYTNFHSTPSYSNIHATPSYSSLHATPGYSTLHGTPTPPFNAGHSSFHNSQPLIHAVNPYSVAINQRYQPLKLSLVKIPQPIYIPRIVLQPFDHSYDHISPFTYPH